MMKNEINENKALSQISVSNSDFRILEYKDHFRIEKKILTDDWFCFLGIFPLYIKGKKETWHCILKDKSFLSIRNSLETEKFAFKSKEECFEWIADYNKYPVYHYR